MAVLKCKMCGGDITVNEDKTVGMCDYCGSTMTLPKVSDDQRAARFNRGNHFRRQGEFDKALAVYETIVSEDETDAEAHWCCALCRFGIEYVEDPNTYEYIPTCHRASFDSFLDDVDYKAALENSDGITRRQYQKDAAKIAEVQRGILATSQNEEPFDVFICYKETDDATKERTRDSIDAQEIYYQLTQEGYRVFFARITLEDKAGTEYEPYIFAALNSAKVMIALGSKPEYLNAVWVKNEWSRFLAMMRKDRSKLLLPCYKGMDPYDLPEQLGVLQSYDMSKIGFMQDLIRGIKKVLQKDAPVSVQPASQPVVYQAAQSNNSMTDSLLQRVCIFLEDGDWNNANQYCERVLDADAQNPLAYIYKMLASMKLKKIEDLRSRTTPFDTDLNYKKAVQFSAGRADCEKEIEEVQHLSDVVRNNANLYDAIKNGDTTTALDLINKDIDINFAYTENSEKIPLLCCAVKTQNVEIVKALLEKGADPNSERAFKDGQRYSALRDSIIEWPNDEIAQLLLDAGADVNYTETQETLNCPVLISAIIQGNPAMVKKLLERGANPNCERVFFKGSRYSALRDSILQWPNDEIAQLLIDAGADVNYVETQDTLNCPLLINAIIKGNVGMVKKLLEKGADPNCERVFKEGQRYSALRDSILQWPNDEIAQLLLDAGADVNYVETNKSMNCALLINAISKGNVGMVKKLLDKGADPNCERVFYDGQRDSALRNSIIQWPNDEITRMLIEAGADVNYVEVIHTSNGGIGRIPVLINAICEKNVGIVELLLKRGANPNCERVFNNGKRYHALRDSILQWPNEKIANLLLDAGASFETDEQLRKAKIDRTRFSRETLARFKKAGWRPPLF